MGIILALLFLGIGIIYKYNLPKHKNMWYGWRTNYSMMNQDTWDYANEYGANAFVNGGIIYVLLSIVTINFISNIDIELILNTIYLLIILIAIIIKTEKQLRKIFDDEGNRK